MGLFSSRYVSAVRLDGKTVIVTGCNTGIGKFTVLDLYKRGCRVIMACRDQRKAELAKNEITEKTLGLKNVGQMVLMPLDLSSLQSVRKFADKILEQERRIDILINNAGVLMCPKGKTVDGFETQFGINHLGHFLLTLLLLPRILASAPARIVNISSLAHLFAGEIDWDNLNAEKSYSPTKNYAVSKLANVLFTTELARRLDGTGVTAYVVHPGSINTELFRHSGTVSMLVKLTSFLQKDLEQGAATTLYCAVDPKTATETGLYYVDLKPRGCHRQGSDPEKSKKLWDVSLEMVQLNDYDPFTPKQFI